MKSIYLDYNATTPLDDAVYRAMIPYLTKHFGNPSSVHHMGQQARARLDACRYRVAEIFQCKASEILFTSGGTESNNLAIFGAARAHLSKGKHIITSAIEHSSVLSCFESLAQNEGFEITILPVSSEGEVDPKDLKSSIRSSTTLVSIMHANNEMGAIQPIQEIATICKSYDVLFHTDAAQSFGKVPFSNVDSFGADMISLCAHKFHGPKGSGILYCRSPLHLCPVLYGGKHENERRAGTENLPAIVGLVDALERFVPQPVFCENTLSHLTLKLIDHLCAIPSVQFHGPKTNRLANTAAFTIEGWESILILAALDLEGICASSGSACSVGSLESSHVLKAMGVCPERTNCLVRFSIGRETTEDEIDFTIQTLMQILDQKHGNKIVKTCLK